MYKDSSKHGFTWIVALLARDETKAQTLRNRTQNIRNSTKTAGLRLWIGEQLVEY